ncbi:hypothetical protein IWQ56_007448, partial [Coemansia nantahalensis]
MSRLNPSHRSHLPYPPRQDHLHHDLLQSRTMNSSNIVAIPNHPPLPRGAPGMFHPVDPSYAATRESKAPVAVAAAAAYDYDGDRRPGHYMRPEQYPPHHHPHHPQQHHPQQHLPQQHLPPHPQQHLPYRPGGSFSGAINRPRSDSGNLTYPTSSYRRNTTSGYDPAADDGRSTTRESPGSGHPGEMPMSSPFRTIRNESVLSDNSGESTGDKAVGYSSDRKYVCDWRNCG